MSKPPTPEHDAIEAQKAMLETITGGADWHTSIGANVVFGNVDGSDMQDHIMLAGFRNEPGGINDAMIYVDWQAIVNIESDDDLTPALVLADMRAALTCTSNKIRLVDTSVELRQPGSNHAVVGVTTAIHKPTR